MKLPPMSVEWVDSENGLVHGFRLSIPGLTADPAKLSDMERTISLLYSYREIMKRLIEMAAPTTARAIVAEERMALEDVR